MWIIFHLKLLKKIYNRIIFYLGYYVELLRFGAESPEFWVDDHNKIIYVVNSKVACTSIKRALYQFAEFADPPPNVHVDVRSSKFRFNSLAGIDVEKYFVFTFVRDPVERILSCYRNKFIDVRSLNRNDFEFRDYLAGYLKLTDSFSLFVDKIIIIPWKYCDRHFVSQYYWIYEKCKVIPSFVGKIENIDSDWHYIQRLYPGLPSLEHHNRSLRQEKVVSHSERELLRRRYEIDVEFWGYK